MTPIIELGFGQGTGTLLTLGFFITPAPIVNTAPPIVYLRGDFWHVQYLAGNHPHTQYLRGSAP